MVGLKAVLTELDFHRNSVLHKVGLIKGIDRLPPCRLDFPLLFRSREIEGFSDQLVVVSNPVARSTFLPLRLAKLFFQALVNFDWCVKAPAFHAFLFADCRLALAGIDAANNSLDFLPNAGFVND